MNIQLPFDPKRLITLHTLKVVLISVCGHMLLHVHNVGRPLPTELAHVGVFPFMGGQVGQHIVLAAIAFTASWADPWLRLVAGVET